MRALTLRDPALLARGTAYATIEFVGYWMNPSAVDWTDGTGTSNIPVDLSAVSGSPAAGDIAIACFAADRNDSNVNAVPPWTAPAGWTLGGHTNFLNILAAYWKVLTGPDLSSTVYWDTPEHDFTSAVTVWRNLDPTTPISAVNAPTAPNVDPDVPVARPGSHLLSLFGDIDQDYNDPNWAGTGPFTQIAYSPTIRWEASLGLYRRGPLAVSASEVVGLPAFPGSPPYDNRHMTLCLQPAPL